ncbi:MAG: bifunctional proline dehydrogenase/L-glutamate gamma-semialdehyde dehydrogenase PutA [Alphaproteobacteria bacterium]|nr:bifunctional proline dehydrogenase/L-glutamate gamma-semialdehyde dehydrogenase PutA [Alphaproteobacteria bacterium]
MIFADEGPDYSDSRTTVTAAYRADESATLDALLAAARPSPEQQSRTESLARRLVRAVREERRASGGLDAFLHEYGLSSHEGVVLMCLAEALLRIPDAATANRLIRDKLGGADWLSHLGRSDSLFVNAGTWGLMLTGRVIEFEAAQGHDLGAFFRHLISRSGEPLIRQAMLQAMRIMARQFVIGRSIEEAVARAGDEAAPYERYSFDMLGEAALTAADAAHHVERCTQAINVVGAITADGDDVLARPGLSLKLSALHPRFAFAQRRRVLDELVPQLVALASQARAVHVGITIDAEEAELLDLTLDVFAAALQAPALAGWDGFGIAVQCYLKRALPLFAWLADLATLHGTALPVRLVKGAYWDAEIKRAQERGLEGYPVFSRKLATDVSYLACARYVLQRPEAFRAMFASHNAHTIAAVTTLAGDRRDYEFQRLHGMGEALYRAALEGDGVCCRVYAPVGSHEELLPYLVRRLLENGANSSFVNRIVDEEAPIDDLIGDPVAALEGLEERPHPHIVLPTALYGEERRNSRGLDLSDPLVLAQLDSDLQAALTGPWQAGPLIGGQAAAGEARPVKNPADHRRQVGTVVEAGDAEVEAALEGARQAAPSWARAPVEHRATILEGIAEAYEAHLPELMALAVREAGKTLGDALAEVREAVDFCRYYAAQARRDFVPRDLPGPTGEDNRLELQGRGVFLCISPWNFPLAIFTGQIAAALAAGNAVIAKPAEQTPLIAALALSLIERAGLPAGVLQLLPGPGEAVGARLVADQRIGGVAFTGSVDTARAVNQSLSRRPGAIVPLIAETGGQNAMIVDSSALTEQVVADVVQSAFHSAGQRCSALRVLYLQHEIAEPTIEMLVGAMAELAIGDPALLETDIGPVIDAEAQESLESHAARMAAEHTLLYRSVLPASCRHGTFVPPQAFEIPGIEVLEREVFGPILHVVRYRSDDIEAVCQAINGTGYGLTLGIHSRIEAFARRIHALVQAGNTYVNRNMVGAVVGVQPFGGLGLSGTGFKAGGPHYLLRFAQERSISINTTASGGNPDLLSLSDDA